MRDRNYFFQDSGIVIDEQLNDFIDNNKSRDSTLSFLDLFRNTFSSSIASINCSFIPYSLTPQIH